jgi:hypothetical protein
MIEGITPSEEDWDDDAILTDDDARRREEEATRRRAATTRVGEREQAAGREHAVATEAIMLRGRRRATDECAGDDETDECAGDDETDGR